MHRVARVPLLFCFRVGFGLHGAFSNRLLKPEFRMNIYIVYATATIQCIQMGIVLIGGRLHSQ